MGRYYKNILFITILPSPTDSVPNYLEIENSKNKVVESIDFSFNLIVRTSKLTKTSQDNNCQK